MEDRLFGLLGISRKARKLIFGLDVSLRAVREGSASLVLLASDASTNTSRAVKNICEECHVRYIELDCTMERLGGCIGRDRTAVVAMTDKLLAKKAEEICHAD